MPPLSCKKCLAILAVLALQAGKDVRRDWLSELLWPDRDEAQRLPQLRNALTPLNKALGTAKNYIQKPTQDTLRLEVSEDVYVDVHEFDTLIRRADSASLSQAIALYKGSLLEGFGLLELEEWRSSERQKREDQCVEALFGLVLQVGRNGNHDLEEKYLRRILQVQPRSEEACQKLMQIVARRSDRQGLREVLEAFRRTLKSTGGPDEEVSAETQVLYQQLQADIATGIQQSGQRSCLGRAVERTALATQFEDVRLITLTGEGGIGKSRLAAQVAEDLLTQFPDGVTRIEFTESLTETQIIRQLTAALNLQEEAGSAPEQGLYEQLYDQERLLLLENGEVVIQSLAEVVSHLLERTNRLKILITSRLPLATPTESIFRLSPLAYPPELGLPVEVLETYGAIQLLVARVQAAQPKFVLGATNADAVVTICQTLDGMPLMLELTAQRARSLSLTTLAAELKERLLDSAGTQRGRLPHQASVRDTINWSYIRLTPEEQTLFRRVAIFANGWSDEAAKAICSDPTAIAVDLTIPKQPPTTINQISVIDLLAQLVDASMVHPDSYSGDETRYRLLMPLQAFAREQLSKVPEEEQPLRQRHLSYYSQLAQQGESKVAGPDQVVWLKLLEQEQENFRTAMLWSRQETEGNLNRARIGMRLATGLWRFYLERGRLTEGREHLDAFLAIPDDGVERARALSAAAALAYHQGSYEAAETYHNESITVNTALKRQVGIASNLNGLGNIARNRREYDAAEDYFTQSLARWQDLIGSPDAPENLKWHIAVAHGNLGLVAYEKQEYENARLLMEEARRGYSGEEDERNVADQELNLGHLAIAVRDWDEAKRWLDSALTYFQSVPEERGIGLAQAGLADRLSEMTEIMSEEIYVEASALYMESLVRLEAAGLWWSISEVLQGLGALQFRREIWEAGVRISGAAEAVRTHLRMRERLRPTAAAATNVWLSEARKRLSKPRFERHWKDGEAMTLIQIRSWIHKGLSL